MRTFEKSLQTADLSQEAIAAFVATLGAGEQQDALRGFIDHRQSTNWRVELGRAQSGWFRAYTQLASRWKSKRRVAVAVGQKPSST
jgi:hypothetical protein